MFDTVEIKFKEKEQQADWEDLPVIRWANKSELPQTIEWAKKIFQCVEIRWNYSGSYQGHYVNGSVSRY